MESPLSSKRWRQTPPTTEEIVSQIVDWSISRIVSGLLDEGDILAITQEFAEWLEPDVEDIQVIGLNIIQLDYP
jgi:DNA-binding transcriptional regulator YhcF (GntR family)